MILTLHEDFLLKQKNINYFCTGCPKVLWEGVKLDFLIFFPRGIRNKKVGKSQTFSGMGCLKILE